MQVTFVTPVCITEVKIGAAPTSQSRVPRSFVYAFARDLECLGGGRFIALTAPVEAPQAGTRALRIKVCLLAWPHA